MKLAMPEGKKSLQVFISYCHQDEELHNQLVKHLEPLRCMGLIEAWYDRKIKLGEEWKDTISENLNKSDIIVLLVNIDFITSNYCYDIELERAQNLGEEIAPQGGDYVQAGLMNLGSTNFSTLQYVMTVLR